MVEPPPADEDLLAAVLHRLHCIREAAAVIDELAGRLSEEALHRDLRDAERAALGQWRIALTQFDANLHELEESVRWSLKRDAA